MSSLRPAWSTYQDPVSNKRAGGHSPGVEYCVACTKPWVLSPELPKQKLYAIVPPSLINTSGSFHGSHPLSSGFFPSNL